MTGVYVFDSWVKEVRKRGVKLCGQFHDELAFPLLDDKSEAAKHKNILVESVQKVNQNLNLNRDFDIDVKFGSSYADVH